MILTEIDMIDAMYGYVSSSGMKDTLGGGLYRAPRPINSDKEDMVISVLATGSGQIQPFVVNVNIYVPDIKRGKEYILDEQRMSFLMREALKILEHGKIVHTIDGKEYDMLFNLESQKIYEVNGENAHAINHKINVSVCTE